MFELLVGILFFWLMIKCLGLFVRLAWGFSKIIVSVLMVLALPLLVACLIFSSGIALLIPIVVELWRVFAK